MPFCLDTEMSSRYALLKVCADSYEESETDQYLITSLMLLVVMTSYDQRDY